MLQGKEKNVGLTAVRENNHLALSPVTFLTYISQTLHGDSKSFCSWQEVVLELGQTFGLGYLHADLVLLFCEPCALTVNQELKPRQNCS